MKPAGQNGIPAAFLVGKTGEIEWIGHPKSLDNVLKQYLAGTWDRAAAKARIAEEQRFAKKGREMTMKAMMAERSGDRAAAAKAFEELAKEFPNNVNVMSMQFKFLLGDAATAERGYAIGQTLMSDHWDDASTLNMLAWTVADDEGVAKRDLSFAMKAATRANELTKHEDASIIDTLARVYWEQGNKAKAIELETKAVALAEDGRMKDSLKDTLASYTSAE
jgi:tetratricopeptide (TPR) repeat protein